MRLFERTGEWVAWLILCLLLGIPLGVIIGNFWLGLLR